MAFFLSHLLPLAASSVSVAPGMAAHAVTGVTPIRCQKSRRCGNPILENGW